MPYIHRICNSDGIAAVGKYRQLCLRRSVFLRGHQHLWVKGSFPSVNHHAERKGQQIYTKRKTLLIESRQIHVSNTRRISTNLNILYLTVGWTWQTEGSIRTTFGSFGNVNLLHCIVGWNFAAGLMLNPTRFVICLLIRLIFLAMESTIQENPTYRTMLFHTEESELPTSLFRKRVAGVIGDQIIRLQVFTMSDRWYSSKLFATWNDSPLKESFSVNKTSDVQPAWQSTLLFQPGLSGSSRISNSTTFRFVVAMHSCPPRSPDLNTLY
jgi:hypothetical protein